MKPPQSHDESSETKRPYRVLLVEDDPSMRELLGARVSRQGLEHVSASCAAEAFAAVNQRDFDLMVVDYRLGDEISGIELYRELSARGKKLPAILITGQGDEYVLTEALRLGIRDFVPKTNSFLNNLALAIDRVLQDIQKERLMEQAKLEKTFYEATAAALNAAGTGLLIWELPSGKVSFSEQLLTLLEAKESPLRRMRDFTAMLAPEDRKKAIDAFRKARQSGVASETEFRVHTRSGNQRWLRVKGRYEKERGGRLLALLWDETEKYQRQMELQRAHHESSALAERLQLSMLEIHHRVKNSFQIVTSLLNMELRKRSVLTEDDVRRVMSYVQGLALIHDLLAEQMKKSPGHLRVEAGLLLDTLCSSLSRDDYKVRLNNMAGRPMLISPRVASSLAVVTTELVINAVKHGSGSCIEVSVRESDNGKGLVEVVNAVAAEKTGGAPSTSGLIDFLAKTDLHGGISRSIKGGSFVVALQFPLHPGT